MQAYAVLFFGIIGIVSVFYMGHHFKRLYEQTNNNGVKKYYDSLFSQNKTKKQKYHFKRGMIGLMAFFSSIVLARVVASIIEALGKAG